MRDFTWHVFTQTGDIEAYLLYKDLNALGIGASGNGAAAEADPEELDAGVGEVPPS